MAIFVFEIGSRWKEMPLFVSLGDLFEQKGAAQKGIV